MLPIKDQVTTSVLASLNGVKIEAGFNTDLESQLVETLPTVPSDSVCVLLEGDDRMEDAPSLGHDGYYQPYTARAWAIEPEEDGSDPPKRLALVAGDIIRGIMLDPHRDELAHNTFIRGVKTYPENEPPAVDVMIEVHYRTLHGDPFNQ